MQALEQEGATRRRVARRLRRQAVEAPRRLGDGAGRAPGDVVNDLAARMEPGDIIIDGGNSYYRDDIDRAEELQPRASTTSTSGRAAASSGSSAAYCLMIGGEPEPVQQLDPIFRTLAPGVEGAAADARPRRRAAPAEQAISTAGPPAPATS